MKIFRIVLYVILSLIVLAIIAGGIFIKYTSSKGIPDYESDISLKNMQAEVTVLRDSLAIPHIYAKNEEDLYRAVGYVMAQDRLWQMDLLRRLTTGRLSEIFGKDMIEADLLFRSLKFSEKSNLVLEKSNPEVIACLEAFADGVNQYIESKGGKLPPEFSILGYLPEPWEPVHSANLIGYMSWGLTMAWSTETILFKIQQIVDDVHYRELIPNLDFHDKYVIPDPEKDSALAFYSPLNTIDNDISVLGLQVLQASNNWAVSGSKSLTGKPLLANDMHLDLNAPGIWYQMHQVVEGKLNVTGVVLPGQPLVICGHNENVAWGMTNVMLDDMDFYVETLKSDDSASYLLNGEWKDLIIKEETIHIKGGDSVFRFNRFTHRGPVVSEIKGFKDHIVSMRWIGMEFSNELNAVYLFNRMKNWDEFRTAAKDFIAISQNMVYADKAGNIGMQTVGGIPIREGNPATFFRGDTSLNDWKGLVPFEELPFVYNPEDGFVASANNRTISSNYPHYISLWFDLPFRYEGIVEELTAKEILNHADFIAIQSKQESVNARKFTPVYLEALKSYVSDMNELEKKAYDLLSEWGNSNFSMDKNSIPATLFEYMFIELIRSVFLDEIGDELLMGLLKQDLVPHYLLNNIRITGKSVWTDNINTTGKQETFTDNIIEAFVNTVIKLEESGVNIDDWKWGNYHTLTLKHPLGSVNMLNRAFQLNRGPFPVGGSFHTVSPYSYPLDSPFGANHGASHRHIYCTANWDNSLVIIPTGTSGIPASDYYCDQTEMYLNYQYKKDRYSKGAVEKNVKYRMVIGGEDDLPIQP